MKAIVGPATNLSTARSLGLLINGWGSEVTQIATGPLIPSGTTHCERGREMVNGKPPTNIWQERPCIYKENSDQRPSLDIMNRRTSVDPFMAGELKVKSVPMLTAPVFVIVRGGFGGTPRSQPEMKGPAMPKTSLGVKAKSNACGIAVPALRTFRIVWWRASMVRIEPAAVRRMGSERRWAAPRYAVTPTFSTRRATAAMVVTSTRTLEKSNLQVSTGVLPRALIPS